MAYPDPMDLSSPPRTPKPISRRIRPSTPYKSNATVISLDSTPEPYDNINNSNNYDVEHHLTAAFLEFEPNYIDNDNSDDFPADFTSPTQRRDNKIPPLKLFRPRTYLPEHSATMQHASEVLDHISFSLPSTANQPEITILLLLTPNPASLAVITDLENIATRFSADFSSVTYNEQQQWHSINLYEHLYGWAARNPLSNGNITAHAAKFDGSIEVDANVDDVGIGSIHPYALHAKLEQEKEVNWRLAIAVLKRLIDREVGKGKRRFMVCGLKVGDVPGVRGFARKVAELNGIFSFLPAPTLAPARMSQSRLVRDHVVPAEYQSRTVTINNTTTLSQPQIYDALLAALYAKQLSNTPKRADADAINHSSARNCTFDDYEDKEEEYLSQEDYMMDWM